MSLFQRPLRRTAAWSDKAVDRYLSAIRDEISLDPLFRRRLRGVVVNRFVSEREGASRSAARSAARRMGTLGRSVLYASVALAVSVTGAMAAAQSAIPGDALYVLKRQIEALRLEALPAHFHGDLAAHALGERIEEIGRLAERADWDRVAAHAAAVAHDSSEFLDIKDVDPGAWDRYLVVLSGLHDRLPERAQVAIQEAVRRLGSSASGAGAGGPGATGAGASGGASNGRGGQNAGGSPDGPPPAPDREGPQSTAAARPASQATPRPTPRPLPRVTSDPAPKTKPPASSNKPTPWATSTPARSDND